MQKSEAVFWRKLAIRTFAMWGFTYFSVAVTLQGWTLLTPSLLSACSYFFFELMRYYKVETPQQRKVHVFLI